jgi:hypothetical protein
MWRQKRRAQRKVNGQDRRIDAGSLTIREANLGTPDFDESWKAGSPLNWVDFVSHWERRRSRRGQARRPSDDT